MKVAIPLFEEDVAIQFQTAKAFAVYKIEIALVKEKLIIEKKDFTIAEFLDEYKINGMICDKIDSENRNLLRLKRIELLYNVSGNVNEVMKRYLSGECLGEMDENAYWSGERTERDKVEG